MTTNIWMEVSELASPYRVQVHIRTGIRRHQLRAEALGLGGEMELWWEGPPPRTGRGGGQADAYREALN